MSEMMRKAIAEFIGTFWLVFAGCGSAAFFTVALARGGGDAREMGAIVGMLGIALAFGLTVVTMAYAIGHISGAHLNPAVSVGMAMAGRLPMNQLGWYVGAQFAGGVVAMLLIALIATQTAGKIEFKQVGLAVANGYGDHSMGGYKLLAALLAELIFTFIFMLVILGATARKATPAMAGLAIGLCLALIHICCIPITGTSVNPARSFGPALVGMGWAIKQVWLFLLVPTAGAVAAAFVHKLVLADGDDD